jgi:hypothetical protein
VFYFKKDQAVIEKNFLCCTMFGLFGISGAILVLFGVVGTGCFVG